MTAQQSSGATAVRKREEKRGGGIYVRLLLDYIRSNNIFDFQIEYVSVLLAVWMDRRAVRKRKFLFTSVDKIPVYAHFYFHPIPRTL